MYVLIKALSHDHMAPTGAADGCGAAGVLPQVGASSDGGERQTKRKEGVLRSNMGV